MCPVDDDSAVPGQTAPHTSPADSRDRNLPFNIQRLIHRLAATTSIRAADLKSDDFGGVQTYDKKGNDRR